MARYNYSSFRQKYCSPKCRGVAQAQRAHATYPPKDEVEALIANGMSDEKIGKHYGRSYTWAWHVRKFHELPPGGFKSGPARKPLRQRSHRARWGIHLKREDKCRSCGVEGVKLSLHHGVPRSVAPSIKFDLRHGLPLCDDCHLGWHRKAVVIYRDAFKPEEWEWLVSLEFTGFQIVPWLEDHYPVRRVPHGRAWMPV